MTNENKLLILKARLAKMNGREINLKSPGVKRKCERQIRNLS